MSKQTENLVWDKAAALELLGGDPELLVQVAQLLLEQSPGLLSSLERSVSLADTQGIIAYAHKLKGSLSALGAVSSCNTARKLEEMALAGDILEARVEFRKLSLEMNALIESLCRFIKLES